MGEYDHPSEAAWAQFSVNRTADSVRDLERRIAMLEMRIQKLEDWIARD